jgi:hypothetical protein
MIKEMGEWCLPTVNHKNFFNTFLIKLDGKIISE